MTLTKIRNNKFHLFATYYQFKIDVNEYVFKTYIRMYKKDAIDE